MTRPSPSLMIVDDEKLTRESLAKYVPWESLSISSVRVARNGIEALALAESDAPEILLTDVRMPKMDGLELAGRVKSLNPQCKVVFLSGYADKAYLKQAIHLQAVSYVEKPVDLAEVQKAIRLAVSAWTQDAADRREAQRLRERLKGSMTLVRDEIARGLVRGDETVRSLAAATDDALSALGPEAPFTVAALRLRWRGATGVDEKAEVRRGILAACGELPQFGSRTSFIGYTDDDTLALILARHVASSRSAGIRTYEELLGHVNGLAGLCCSATIGIGVPVRGVPSLPRSFASALETLRLAFYRDGPGCVFFPSPPGADRFAPNPDDLARIRESLRVGDRDAAIAAVRAVSAAACRQEPRDVESVRDAFARISALLPRTAGGEESPGADREMRECGTLRELTELVVANISAAVGWPHEDERLPCRLREARRFLRGHYADPNLTLWAIAEHVGLSRTYLSTLYKAATGRNIAEEITELRIGKAKELLLEPRMKTREVAARVGYRDAGYFSALFRKRVGKSPSEYRENV